MSRTPFLFSSNPCLPCFLDVSGSRPASAGRDEEIINPTPALLVVPSTLGRFLIAPGIIPPTQLNHPSVVLGSLACFDCLLQDSFMST